MKAEDQFHLGIVTDDFEATRAQLSAVFGYEWGAEVGGPVQVTLTTGDTVLELRCAYSVTAPRLELVRSVPGTLWEPAAGVGIHHIGYWSDDVAADSAELGRQGFVTEATRTGPDGTPFFSFQRNASGLRVELVNRAAQSGLEQCWAAVRRPRA
ncbi:VOC family protein [Streptomyces sp. NPDC002088]|uniref:VOC family protein n=1 Tax=Streptomyces sp. NPDC002088 TaxID=3154665 RepID=UPI00331C8901